MHICLLYVVLSCAHTAAILPPNGRHNQQYAHRSPRRDGARKQERQRGGDAGGGEFAVQDMEWERESHHRSTGRRVVHYGRRERQQRGAVVSSS